MQIVGIETQIAGIETQIAGMQTDITKLNEKLSTVADDVIAKLREKLPKQWETN